ncbi:VCBS domain-containing protein [Agarivorans aestuarii]|uniref:VCBS domain-containing protein n=1 Tax=Agarivorans aestuarii TaxID=1563703 RepID=UPI001C7E1D16|nr:VCBS domain-containing protein [Agarivorans aestuarii]
MTKQQDKSSLKAKSKLTKSSNSVDKDKGIKKAKRIDEDVARLKAKELRDVKTAGLSNQDLVADKSHQQLLSEQQALPDEGLLSEATNPSETISETGKGGESANAKSSEYDDTSKAVAGAAMVEAPLIDGSKATARVGKGGGSSANSHWFAAHSLLNHVGVKGLTSNQLANVEGNHYKPSVTVQQLTKANHSQTDQQQVPVIHAEGAQQQSGSVKEDKVSEVSGQLHVAGVDANQVSWSVESGSGVYGQLVVDSHTGQWLYQLDNVLATTNALAEGEHHSEQFVVLVKDNLQHQIKMVVSIEVEGSNDKPQISGLHHANVTEMAALSEVDGQLFAKDPDHSEQLQWAVSHSQGQYGRLTINPDNGQWQYQLDNKQPATLALIEGQMGVEHFVVSVTDSAGEVVKQDLTIQVLGTNEQAVIGGGYSGVLSEDKDVHQGQLHADGVLTVTDLDSGQNQFQANLLQGQFGTLSINELGHWTYTADNSQTAIQGLKSGESLTDTLVVHSVDGTEQKITVTINGTDDKAVIGGTATASLTEDKDVHSGLLRVDGALTVSDVDAGENQFQATSLQGQFGTLSINNQGHWTYTADNSQTAIQGLKSGESLTDTLVVHSVDGTEQKISVTINGTDDKARIAGASTADLAEDKEVHQGQLRVDGALTVTDADAGQSQFAATTLQGQFGTLSINQLGHWTYTADNSQTVIQGLKTGESLTDTLLVHSVDGTEQKITVTINGTDDKAVIGGTTTASLTEDKEVHQGQLRVEGALTITDADAGQSQFAATTPQGQFGTLSINQLGHWSYTADNSQPTIQGLKSGESLTDTLVVHSVDGTEQKITVTIDGTDDKAVIAGTATASLTEDKEVHSGLLRVDGALTITDADAGQNQFAATSLQGQFGTLSINNLGHWTYTADNSQTAIQGLKAGESVTDTLVVHSVDGTEQKITVTINGTDDKARIAGASTADLAEDKEVHSGQLRVDGALTITDADSGEAQFQATSLQGQFGTLSINELGHWNYTADNSQTGIQGLKSGESLTDTLLVHSVDGTEQRITVTINGTDDKAQIAGASTANLTEEKDVHQGQLRVGGALTVTDADNGQAQFTATSLQGQFGTLSINELGHWTYTADNSQTAIQGLKSGESLTDTLLVHSVDGTEQKITVTINGTDDKAVIGGTATASLTEDKEVHSGLLRVDGALTVTDADAGQNQFAATSLQGQFGTLSINELGHWVYTADNSQSSIQGLKTGESLTDTLLVHSVDGTEQKITVTINGTDDKAQIAGAFTANLTEDKEVHSGLLRVDGALTITDADAGQNQFAATSLQGQFGTLSINNLGHWTYTADNSQTAIQGLKAGESVTDTLVVHSIDGTEQKITVTINGSNDLPVISGVSSGNVIEQGENITGKANATGTLIATDLDSTDSIQWAISQPQGQFGNLSIDQQGNWRYQLDNSTGGTTDKLAAGQQQQETFWVTATDSSGVAVPHKVVVDVTGSNDKPIVTAWAQLAAGTEDKPVIIQIADLLRHASDIDTTDTLRVENLQASHGHLINNNDGSYTFTPDKDFNGEVRLSYNVVDGQGGSVSTQAKFDLAASPDNAVITDAQTNPNLRGVTEDRGYIDTHYKLNYNGQLNIQDADAGEAKFDPNIGPQTNQGIGYDTKLGGHVVLMQNGHYTYTLDNRNIQHLAEGEAIKDSVVIRSADGTTHTIEMTVHGTNDRPTIAAQSHTVIEGGALIYGQMRGQDIDTGATLHYSTPKIDGLIFNTDGSYSFDPSNSSYQSLASGVTKTLTIPVTVTDEHNASSTQNLTISITGVNNAAVIGGVDTGSVTENSAGKDMSPDYAQPGMSHLGNSPLYASGALTITDVDTDESAFDSHGVGYNYVGKYGDLLLREDGTWSYYADAGNIRGKGGHATNRGTAIDHLGKGETLTDTVTVYSKDGTSHDIVITIHGSNDRPYCSSEVQLNAGTEDTRQTITVAQLLQHTVDVDKNDAGLLSIENLRADHGSIKHNQDGSFTFTPEKDYNGQVHFTYDVKDAHGGITHTGASTSLTAVDDHTVFAGITADFAKEDVDPGANSYGNFGGSRFAGTQWHQLTITDTDSKVDQIDIEFGGKTVTWQVGSPLDIQTNYGKFELTTYSHGPHKGELVWLYNGDNRNPSIQGLKEGESLHESITLVAPDGTRQALSVEIKGTEDHVIIDAPNHLGDVIEHQSTGAQVSGQLQAHDSDTHDSVSWAITQTAGKYGEFSVDTDGHWHYVVDESKAGVLGQGDEWNEHFTIEAISTDGSRITKTVTVVVHGSNDAPTVKSGLVLSQGSEDKQVILTQQDLLAHASDSDRNDQGWLSATHLTADHGTISTNADGSFTFTPDKDYNGDVQFTYDVTDRHGGVTATSATMNLAAVADAATISGATQGVAFEDHGIFANNNNNTIIEVSGHIFVNDPDAGEQGFRYGTGTKIDDPFNGHLHISANGTWVYDVDNIKLQHLAANEEVLVTHRVYSKDGTPQDIVIKITGTNDNALINGKVSAVSQGTLTEDSKEHTISGTLTLTDVDTGEDKFATISQLAGQYGYLSMDRQGNWSYTLDNSLATTNGLVAGQVVTESFTVTSPDGTASHTINVQIHGHDDTPSLSVNEGGAAKSLDLLGGFSSGTVSHMQFSTDGVHYTNQVPDGFMLDSDGHTLQVDPAHNSYNHLANGIALKIDIKYQLQQGAGRNALTSQQQAQVVVTGTSDRPILHSFNPHSQQNSGPVTGNLLQGATDIDDGAHLVLHDVQFQDPTTHQYVTVQAGQTHNITGVGVIAISANGDYSFTPNSQFSGQVPNLIYRVTDTNGDYADNSQNNLDIHIDPYQAPIIIAPLTVALANDTGSSATDLVTQDGTLSISGQTAGMQVEYSIDGGKNWSTQFSPIEGVNQLQVRQTDGAGHTSAASSLSFTLDTQSPSPHISLDPVTADNVLNQTELSANLAVTGTVSRDVNVGDKVTLTLGARTYTGAVDANHQFSIGVPADQLGSHTNIMASITITDEAGNSATATDNHHYSTDTIASIRVNPITSDNIIEASEHHQAIDIDGTVSGVEDGQVVTVSIGGHHYQAVVAHGAWSTSLTAAEVQALPGGTVDVTASVHDLAGNLASIHSPLFVGDSANPVPSLSFKAPPTPTGGGSIGSHISGDLVVPPLIQQLTPNLPSGGWAITDGKGHTSTSLHGQYGTLTIDPDTGHVDYVYSQAPTPGNKAAGGSHWAGQTTSEEHHDVFQVVYHDAHASNVDVKVNLDVTYVHGHSGHNQTSTHLVAMTVTPDTSVAMPPAADMHDAPDDIMTFSASITEDEPSFDEAVSHIGGADESTPHQSVHLDLLNQSEASSPIDHYLQMVGVSHADITPASEIPLATDLPDMAATQVNQDEELFDSQPIDAFENPLDEDKYEQHKLNEQVIHDDTLVQHQVNQDNDDDLLHQALNDMHNQW